MRLAFLYLPVPITGEPPKAVENSPSSALPGYRISVSEEDAARKAILHANLKARAKVWTSHDLSICSNAEYVYAIRPIALDLFCGKGGRGVTESKYNGYR